MSRTSNDLYQGGRLMRGFDYEKQCWVRNGRYLNCGHPENMTCGCYGRAHKGEKTTDRRKE